MKSLISSCGQLHQEFQSCENNTIYIFSLHTAKNDTMTTKLCSVSKLIQTYAE